MARSHGKILVDIWIDPDFLALDLAAQWAYMMLLSQPKLSLVGSIDYEPHRWAQLANGLTERRLEGALSRLEAAGFVCIDRTTREVLVRSMTRHDGLRTNNPKLLKGLWGQWKGIASAGLRKVAVDNMPETLFGTDDTPPAAEHLRRSERMDWAIASIPIARSFRLPPSTTRRPPTADAQSVTRSALPVDNVDLERHPVERIPDECRELARTHLALLKSNPAATGDSVVSLSAGLSSEVAG